MLPPVSRDSPGARPFGRWRLYRLAGLLAVTTGLAVSLLPAVAEAAPTLPTPTPTPRVVVDAASAGSPAAPVAKPAASPKAATPSARPSTFAEPDAAGVPGARQGVGASTATRVARVTTEDVSTAPSARQAAGASPTPTTAPTRVPASPTPTPAASVAAAPREAAVRPSTPIPPPVQPAIVPNFQPPRFATFVVQPTVQPTATPVLVPRFAPTRGAVKGWIEGTLLALDVPIRSQFDGTEYQSSNCGPTSLAMVLDAFGVLVPTDKLRNLANLHQGTYDRESGIALDYLAEIAAEAGLRPLGLRDGGAYRRWSVAELRDEVRRGHPVMTLVKMRELPDHAASTTPTDHYVVVVGLDGPNLLVNDPALPGEAGYRRSIAPEQLERAWAASSIPGHAVAIAAGAGVPEVNFPDPARSAALLAHPVAPAGAPEASMMLPVVPAPVLAPPVPVAAPALPPALGAPVGAPAMPVAQSPQQVVIVLTPSAPQVIVLQVPAPALATPTPLPARERWERPYGYAPAMVAEPLVLGQQALAAPNPNDIPWRQVVVVAEVLAAVVVLRWALK